MRLVYFFTTFLFLVSFFVQAEDHRYQNISGNEAQDMITTNKANPNFYLLDVRTLQEYQQAHIEGANQLNFYEASFANDIAKLDPKKTYLIYCRSGVRSSKTLALMKSLNFTQVYNLQGGIVDWYQQKLPLVLSGSSQ